jgi:hypothetical protein
MTSSTTSRTESAAARTRSDAATTATDARDTVVAAASEARDALDSMARTMPDVARASRGLMDDAMRAIERGSDERVSAGVTLSLGLAIGMLIGGAPRLLTVLALVPVAAMGIVLVDRRSQAGGRSATA